METLSDFNMRLYRAYRELEAVCDEIEEYCRAKRESAEGSGSDWGSSDSGLLPSSNDTPSDIRSVASALRYFRGGQ